MEPKRFEEQIKEQLQKREIKPSARSWEKLEAGLEQEKKPSGVRFWWTGAAAAIAGVFFFLGTLVNDPGTPAVVEESPKDVRPKEMFEKPEEGIMVASEEPEKEEVLKTEVLPQKKPAQKIDRIAEVTQPVKPAEVEPILISEVRAEKLIAEAVPKPAPVSDAEVEALLNTAMAELEQQEAAYAVQPVDAQELLQEVERELDRNFRQKVFEVLKEGFSKARTAMANRNY
ncbi:hypothetical protein SAMN04488034_10764 [Salinimicrobium catena]|uniref:Uncharacterized protein n=1 Tax=Salinimicrobium catena TaxID=390640 RepID=A0A1H5NZM6_9FLAO|nr:hypothetical protein [Salinimicrobium catena]SDL63558.1 hypothetical protein SAMN04488140_10722 [Salinimicrobium catena]SEF07133.1 hypothetical protein SAMN04488034_10764 [Salinimicrobium catena]